MPVKTHEFAIVVAAAAGLLLMAPAFSQARELQQPDERFLEQPPRENQRPARDPQAIAARIEKMQKQLEDLQTTNPDSPEVLQLQRRLNRLNGIFKRMQRRHRAGRPDALQPRQSARGNQDRQQYSKEQIQAFIETHAELARIFETRPDGHPAGPEHRRRLFARNQPKVERIMQAYDAGEEDYAELLIRSAQLQFDIGQKVWQYHHSDLSRDQQAQLSRELSTLVRQQVEQELLLREAEIRQLESRLEDQRQELNRSRQRIDQVTENKLHRLLADKQDRSRRRNRRVRQRGLNQDQLPESDTKPE